MQVILLEKIRHFGDLGQQVAVKPGYARYLVREKKAVTATPQNIQKFESQRAVLEKQAAEVLQAAQARAAKLADTVINMAARAQEDGKLFGSIGAVDLAQAMNKLGADIKKSEIRLPTGPLRAVGEYEVFVQLHADISLPVKVVVVAEA